MVASQLSRTFGLAVTGTDTAKSREHHLRRARCSPGAATPPASGNFAAAVLLHLDMSAQTCLFHQAHMSYLYEKCTNSISYLEPLYLQRSVRKLVIACRRKTVCLYSFSCSRQSPDALVAVSSTATGSRTLQQGCCFVSSDENERPVLRCRSIGASSQAVR